MWRGAKVSRGLKIDVEEWVGGKRVQCAVEAGEMAVVEWDRNGVFAVDVDADVDVVDTDRKPKIDEVGTDTFETGLRRHVLERVEVRAIIDLISTVYVSQSLFLDWDDHVHDSLYTFQAWVVCCCTVSMLFPFRSALL